LQRKNADIVFAGGKQDYEMIDNGCGTADEASSMRVRLSTVIIFL